jgi:hypothetical protein
VSDFKDGLALVRKDDENMRESVAAGLYSIYDMEIYTNWGFIDILRN